MYITIMNPYNWLNMAIQQGYIDLPTAAKVLAGDGPEQRRSYVVNTYNYGNKLLLLC